MGYLDSTGLQKQIQYIKAYVENQISAIASNGTANRAAADGLGNNIAETYATKTELSAIPQFDIQVVNALPTANISDTTVYLVLSNSGAAGNLYTEYIHVNDTWEKLGEQTTEVDLSDYMPKSGGTFTGNVMAPTPEAADNSTKVATTAYVNTKLSGYSTTSHTHKYAGSASAGGAATSANKLATGKAIDGVTFDGSAAITHYGTCSTEAATAAKTVACTLFTLVTGSRIVVKFTVTNTAANPTLNVNSTGAKAIQYRGAAISAGYLAANRTYEFIYDGTNYQLVGDIDTNTTYSAGTESLLNDGTDAKNRVWPATQISNYVKNYVADKVVEPDSANYLKSAGVSGSTLTLTKGDDTTVTFTANNYTHPTTAGNKHIPSGGSAGNILKWSSNGTAVWGDDDHNHDDRYPIISNSGRTEIVSDTDLNTITTPGTYFTSGGNSGSAVHQTLLNSPTNGEGSGFLMYVISTGVNGVYPKQIIYMYNGDVYERTHGASSWGEWHKRVYEDDCAAVDHTHDNYVDLTSKQTITGQKIFKQEIVVNRNVATKGTPPSSTTYPLWIGAYENGDGSDVLHPKNRFGAVGTTVYKTTGDTETTLYAYKNVADSTLVGKIGVFYPTDGDPYGFAPTPASTSNTNHIATTEWVNTKLDILDNYLNMSMSNLTGTAKTGDDLNDFTTPGTYAIPNSSTSSVNIDNVATTYSHRLFVMHTANGNYLTQIAMYGSNIWRRYGSKSNGVWTWSDWKTIANTDSNISGNAATATALTTSAGSATNPVYFSDGKPVATTYTLGKSVPSDAVFTDTVYTHPTSAGNIHLPSGGASGNFLKWSSAGTGKWESLTKAEVTTALGYTPPTTNTTYSNMTAATASAAGAAGLVPTPAKGKQDSFLRGNATWATASDIINTLSTGTSSATADDYVVCQYAGGGTTTTTYHRRPVSKLLDALTKAQVTTALGYTPPTTNTTYSNMTAATANAAGKAGLVPAPAAGKQTSFLRGDGTWVVPTNTTYSAGTTALLVTGSDTANRVWPVKQLVDYIKPRSVEFIKGTQTAATGAFTGVTTDAALYDGKTIRYYLPYAGSGNATLNLTLSGGGTTGAKVIYWSGTSQLTTHYGAGSVMTLTYVASDDKWHGADYNSNTTNSAGAGNSKAKLFLVGTTAQSTGTSYSNANVYATNGALHATSISTGGNVVVGGTANTNYLQLPSGIKLY